MTDKPKRPRYKISTHDLDTDDYTMADLRMHGIPTKPCTLFRLRPRLRRLKELCYIVGRFKDAYQVRVERIEEKVPTYTQLELLK